MQHISDDDLVLTYYGEHGADASLHLEACAECRLRCQALQRTLNIVDMPVPERSHDYAAQVWSRLEPKLGPGARVRWRWLPARWLAASAMATIALAAFMGGRFLPDTATVPAAIASAPATDRVLVAAVGDHLERSQFVLAELLNGKTGELGAERSRARTLVDENRLYRTAAATSGDAGVAMLLDDLERILLEIAHSSDKPSTQELDAIRERVRGQSLLFKVRVLGARLKEEAGATPDASHRL